MHSPGTRNTGLRAVLRASRPLLAAVLVHGLAALGAALFVLSDPARVSDRLTVTIVPTPPLTREIPRPSRPLHHVDASPPRTHAATRRPAPVPPVPAAAPPGTSEMTTARESASDASESKATAQRRLPDSLTVKRMTPEEAIAELGRLLERHPEYRTTILREMFAGDGAVPPVEPLTIVGLAQILSMPGTFSGPTVTGSHAMGSGVSPIYGTDRGRGAQLNVIGLLLFLIDLIGGGK